MRKQPFPSYNNDSSVQKVSGAAVKPGLKIKMVEKTVLPEETYLSGMSAVLKKDFFPELAKLEAEEAFLDALERFDSIGVKRASEKYIEACRELETVGPSEGIEEYRYKFTSEDNQSFASLMQTENQTKRLKFERVFGGPAMLKADPSRRLLLGPSEIDQHKVNVAKSEAMKQTITTNTRLRKLQTRSDTFDWTDLTTEETVYRQILKDHGAGDRFDDDTRSVTTEASAYDTIPNTPSITPGVEGTPLMTWGNVTSTPVRLETPGRPSEPSPYRLPTDTLNNDRVKVGKQRERKQQTPKATATALTKVIMESTRAEGSTFDFPSIKKTVASDRAALLTVLNTPIIPRTPMRTPSRSPKIPKTPL